MKLILPSIHSYSDLITNSSSETFICGKSKNVKAIKACVEKLYYNYYNIHSDIADIEGENFNNSSGVIPPPSSLWGGVLREPEASPYEFTMEYDGFYGLPHQLYTLGRGNCYGICDDIDDEIYQLKNEARRLQLEVDQETRNTKAGVCTPQYREIVYKHLVPFFKPLIDEFTKMFYLNILPKNGFDSDDELFELDYSIYGYNPEMCINVLPKDTDNDEHYNFCNFINSCISYHYEVRKGQIIIDSVNDNSVPGDFMNILVNTLDATRIHLG